LAAAVVGWAFILKGAVRYGFDDWLGRVIESGLAKLVLKP
jgi:hypothetical protein